MLSPKHDITLHCYYKCCRFNTAMAHQCSFVLGNKELSHSLFIFVSRPIRCDLDIVLICLFSSANLKRLLSPFTRDQSVCTPWSIFYICIYIVAGVYINFWLYCFHNFHLHLSYLNIVIITIMCACVYRYMKNILTK